MDEAALPTRNRGSGDSGVLAFLATAGPGSYRCSPGASPGGSGESRCGGNRELHPGSTLAPFPRRGPCSPAPTCPHAHSQLPGQGDSSVVRLRQPCDPRFSIGRSTLLKAIVLIDSSF